MQSEEQNVSELHIGEDPLGVMDMAMLSMSITNGYLV